MCYNVDKKKSQKNYRRGMEKNCFKCAKRIINYCPEKNRFIEDPNQDGKNCIPFAEKQSEPGCLPKEQIADYYLG